MIGLIYIEHCSNWTFYLFRPWLRVFKHESFPTLL